MMMSKRTAVVLLVTALGLTAACTDQEALRKQKVMSELRDVETEREPLARQVTSRTERVAAQENRVQQLKSQLEDYERQMQAYLMNHKMAVAAIALGVGGAGVALSDDNEYSDDAKALGGIGAVIAAIWALNNGEEVMAVLDALVQADANVKNLKGQIAQAETGVRQEGQLLARDRQQLQSLTEKIASLRGQL